MTEVIYPGLESHPDHELAQRQMRGSGGMVAFRTGSREKALEVCARAKVFTLAESLGGVESLIERRRRYAAESPTVPESQLRLSVGIEDVDDLWRDLARALDSRPA